MDEALIKIYDPKWEIQLRNSCFLKGVKRFHTCWITTYKSL